MSVRAALLLVLATISAAASAAAPEQAQTIARDGSHDFDFLIGKWKAHLRRLPDRLVGSTRWVEYDGISNHHKLLDSNANFEEFEVDGPAGHIEALSLRLYNPQSRQWSLNFANSAAGTMAVPTLGEFRNGRGEFYDQETLNGRAILVRFLILPVSADTIRFEQAYSDDGGKTWELNWVALDTRVKESTR